MSWGCNLKWKKTDNRLQCNYKWWHNMDAIYIHWAHVQYEESGLLKKFRKCRRTVHVTCWLARVVTNTDTSLFHNSTQRGCYVKYYDRWINFVWIILKSNRGETTFGLSLHTRRLLITTNYENWWFKATLKLIYLQH